jgi:hypothetical protein
MKTSPLFLALCLSAGAGFAVSAELDLVPFHREFDSSNIQTTDATVSVVDGASGWALRVQTGRKHSWPGIALPAPDGGWDLSPFGFVTARVKNSGTNAVTVSCRVDNPGADGTSHCVTGNTTIQPGQTGTIRVELTRSSSSTMDGKLFGMRGYPVAPGGPRTVDPSKVNQLLLFVSKPSVNYIFDLLSIRAEGTYVAPTAGIADADPFFPFIDTFGQYKHKDWPGKTDSLEHLSQRRTEEARELAEIRGPADWNQYGGWNAGPHLRATGFFRVEKYEGKWWLIDPEGRLFFSHGIDCVRMHDATPIEERETWFENFPGDLPDFREFIVPSAFALKGHYAGRNVKCFSFAGANLKRKYGPEWRQLAGEIAHRRLRSWGMNTVAMWSDESIRLMRKTPYVDAIGTRGAKTIEGSEGYWAKFPDVFDPGFTEGLRRGMATKAGKSAGDPWCLGFFADNEMSWGDEVSLAIAALRSPPEQEAKKVFVADLKSKYGEIGKLNQAWGTAHETWEALLASREAPDRKRAWEDLTWFYTKIAEQYFRTVRDTIKEVAPNQLYLGCRFAWGNARAAAAAAKYCDVVSYNLYRRSVADFQFNGGADVPLIIGEFHFGALDRGIFHTGLVPVGSQEERAQAYKSYVEGALRHPAFVGTHWFQYQDQPTTGRVLDEENYQIGFIDLVDTPHREMVAVSREIGANLYRIRLGR